MEQQTEEQILQKLRELPVVDSVWTRLTNYYRQTKDYNALLRATLEAAEMSVKKVNDVTLPVVERYQPQIGQLNAFACEQLTKLEKNYPVIKKTPEEIIADSKDTCSALIQPAVDKVTSAKELGSSTLSSVKQLGSSTMHGAKDFGVGQLSKVWGYGQGRVEWIMQTEYGQEILHKVETYITCSEAFLDKYLPEGEPEKREDGTSAQENIESKEMLGRLHKLSLKARNRIFKRALREMRTVQLRTRESLEKLTASANLIAYAQSNVADVRGKMLATWKEVVADEPFPIIENDQRGTLEKCTISIARSLAKQVRENIELVHLMFPKTTGILWEKAEESKKYSNQLYSTMLQVGKLQDIPSKLISKTIAALTYLQQNVVVLALSTLGIWQKESTSEEIEMECLHDSPVSANDTNEKLLSNQHSPDITSYFEVIKPSEI